MPRSSDWSSSRAPGLGGSAVETGTSRTAVPLIASRDALSRGRAGECGLFRDLGRDARERFDRGGQSGRLVAAGGAGILRQPPRALAPPMVQATEGGEVRD